MLHKKKKKETDMDNKELGVYIVYMLCMCFGVEFVCGLRLLR